MTKDEVRKIVLARRAAKAKADAAAKAKAAPKAEKPKAEPEATE